MIKIALLINHNKLCDAVISNFDLRHVSFEQERVWEENSKTIFATKHDILMIDFNTIKNETLDVFLTIDTMCCNEGIRFVLLVKKTSEGLRELQRNLTSLSDVVETQAGRKEFDRRIRTIISEVAAQKETINQNSEVVEAEIESEIHFELKEKGSLSDIPIFDLLFSILIRKATGNLFLENGPLSLSFSFRGGAFVSNENTDNRDELIRTISWKGGSYRFQKQDKMAGRARPLEEILAKSVKEVLSQRDAMQFLLPEMDLYPIPTSNFEIARKLKINYPELALFVEFQKKKMKWKDVFAEHGESFFNVAYFAMKTHIVHSSLLPDQTITVLWSQEIRKARDRGERNKVEQTKAFRTAQDPKTVERELRNSLRDMEYQSPYEIFGLWEGCGRKNIKTQFYTLVKEKHPDVYGNISNTVKQYAQKIFIEIKNAYDELLALEQSEDPIALGEPSFTEESVFPKTSIIEEEIPDPIVAKARTPTDVKAKMGQLSAMRKKRSRRRSFANKKVTQPKLTPAPTSEAARILSDAISEPSVQKEKKPQANPRLEKLKQLRLRAKKKNPYAASDAQELFSAGYQLYREKDFNEAYLSFEKAYALDPTAAHKAFYAFSLFKKDEGDSEKAEELVREAIEMNDKQSLPDALYFLAVMLKSRGDKKNALKFFEKALALNPTNREAEREVRLYKIRKEDHSISEAGTFIKNLFKK